MSAPVWTDEQLNAAWDRLTGDAANLAECCDRVSRAVLSLEAERDALAAKVAELEGKALAYDDAHQGDFHERAHKLARWDAKDIGRNVWHIAVERAEKAEAKVAVLAEEVKAWRDADGCKVHEANWEAVCNAVAATNASGALNG